MWTNLNIVLNDKSSTNYLHLGKTPSDFSSHKEVGIFIRFMSEVPSLQVLTEGTLIKQINNSTPQGPFQWLEKEHPSDKRWKKRTHDMPLKKNKNPYFFVTNKTKSDGVFIDW